MPYGTIPTFGPIFLGVAVLNSVLYGFTVLIKMSSNNNCKWSVPQSELDLGHAKVRKVCTHRMSHEGIASL